MQVKEIMTKDLVVGEMDQTLEMAEMIMDAKKIGHLFIIENGTLKGVISDGDIKRRKSFLAGTDISTVREEHTLELKVHQFMTRKLLTLHEYSTLTDAIDIFLKRDIHCLPVIDDSNRLVGIVTGSDLLRQMKRMLNAV